MSQAGYTPISLYYSTTASATPTAGNLTNGELAINIQDEKLYFKNAAGTVKLLASNASSTGTVSSVAQSFTGGLISVSGSPITTSGTLALTVAGTSGGVPYFSSASTWASSAILAANAIMLGGGAGAAPATTTTGTGVVTAIGNNVNTANGLVTQTATLTASDILLGGGSGTGISSTTTGTGVVTALGVNVGTAGAFVVNGGALGTPSSGTVTNLTGTASININGTVGATTPTTGAFTTLTASSDSSFTSTGALQISKGTTGQQPGSPATGMIRYNTTTNQFEGYSGASPSWSAIGGGAAVSNDTSTASNLYPLFANATTGTPTTIYTSNANLLYKPSTGELTALAHISSNGINVNSQTVSVSYTIAAGNNGLSAGTVSVATGITVTVATGSVWTVV